MARKEEYPSDSSLSPPPDDAVLAQQAETNASVTAETNGQGKKRKAVTETTVRATKRSRESAVKEDIANGNDAADGGEGNKTPISKKRAMKTKVKETTVEEELKSEKVQNGETEVKTKKKRTVKKKGADLLPLEERTVGSKLLVGAHVSIAGGLHNAIPNLVHIGANAFALFMKNQRKWNNPALDPEHAAQFIQGCKDHSIDVGACCVPHGSYLVNLAHPDKDRKKQAYDSFHDDLVRCHKVGIKLYNFHPGNSNATTREEGIRLIAEHINNAHKDPETGEVIPVLETMASQGNTIGGTFKDIAEIIDHVENKDRVGVCLDTCHVFAAGYDLRTPETYAEVMKSFDEIIGLKYLKAFHMNDSKAPLASYRDLHARIGTGYLGLRAFHNIVNDERLHGLPMVLETPIDVVDSTGKKIEDKGIWAREIKLLEKLVGMDATSEEFKTLEADLEEAGKGERERIGGQVERKKKKDASPKKKKSKKMESEDEEDEE